MNNEHDPEYPSPLRNKRELPEGLKEMRDWCEPPQLGEQYLLAMVQGRALPREEYEQAYEQWVEEQAALDIEVVKKLADHYRLDRGHPEFWGQLALNLIRDFVPAGRMSGRPGRAKKSHSTRLGQMRLVLAVERQKLRFPDQTDEQACAALARMEPYGSLRPGALANALSKARKHYKAEGHDAATLDANIERLDKQLHAYEQGQKAWLDTP
jgi:hypothetical protein